MFAISSGSYQSLQQRLRPVLAAMNCLCGWSHSSSPTRLGHQRFHPAGAASGPVSTEFTVT